MWRKSLLAIAMTASCQLALAQERIVALTPDVAELLVALKAEHLLVGRDKLARQPSLQHIPVIGSSRALTPPPILAAKPSLVIGSDQAQPPGIYQQLDKLGLKVSHIARSDSPAAFADGIRRVGGLIGKTPAATKLAAQWQQALQPRPATGKRILLSYDGRMVAGNGTAGDALIRAAGATNAASNLDGLLPMTPEAWLRAAPDVVIVAAHNAPMYGGLDGLKARPELASSPAVKNGQLHAWPAGDFLRLGVDSPLVIEKLRKLAQ